MFILHIYIVWQGKQKKQAYRSRVSKGLEKPALARRGSNHDAYNEGDVTSWSLLRS